MADNLIARIILLPDGSTHIALDNSQTYVCTAVSLRDFLSDPALFKGEAYKNYKNTTQYTAPRKVSLEEIHGITLATLNSDYHLTFKFLDLFLIAFKNVNTLAQNNPINFKQYINQIHVDNQQRFWIDFLFKYCEYSQGNLLFDQNIQLSPSAGTEVIQEIISVISQNKKRTISPNNSLIKQIEIANENANEAKNRILSNQNSKKTPEGVPEHYVTVKKYAEIKGISSYAVNDWLHLNKLCSAIKISNRWWIDPNETPPNRRIGKIAKLNPKTGKYRHRLPKNPSYNDIQQNMIDRNLFVPEVRPYIHHKKEIQYFTSNRHRVVCWEGKYYFIIYVNFEYITKKDGRSNRQRILDGDSPVVPNDEDNYYHLHHVGQNSSSPLAIIPSKVHISTEYYSVFHPREKANYDEKQFEKEKHKFWLYYLNLYDSCDKDYNKIDYLNRRSK